MSKRICKRCGQEFESKYVANLCDKCKIGKCIICGEEFSRVGKDPKQECCSRKCSSKYRVITGKSKSIAKKAQETRLEKYGTLSSQGLKLRTLNCKFCGKEFTTTSTRKIYCDGPHYGPCPVCGNPSEIKDLTIKDVPTCSEECRQEKIRRTNQEKYGVDCVFQSEKIKDKSKETMQSKYGVDYYSQTSEYREKYNSTMKERYGVTVPLHSDEITQKQRQTNLEKYGVPYPVMNDSVKEKAKETFESEYGGYGWASPVINGKIRQTNIERYGTEFPTRNPEVQLKTKSTMLEKYGTDPYRNPEITAKREATNLEKYGVTCSLSSIAVREKILQTVRDKYGVDNPFQSEEIKKRIAETNLQRYGVVNPMQNEDLVAKAQYTNLLRYGYPTFKGSDADLLRSSFDSSKIEVYKKFRDDTEEFLKSYDEPPTMRQLIDDTGTNATTVSFIVTKHQCQHLIKYVHTPYMEQDIIDFLNEYLAPHEIKQHDRAVISPKEIDIYLPNYHVGIECNPTYTHNSSKRTHFVDMVLPINYHLNKTLECNSKGIHLIHIFGYQWSNKPEIVKSMILNSVGKTPTRYFARKCEIKEVSDADSRLFLNENHIQGYTVSKVRLGLYFDDELVSLMTFSRKRGTLGKTSKDTKDDWELTRFCNKKFSRCVGGASKLFKHFLNNFHPNTVVSFSDRSNTRGTLYDKLGFQFDSYSNPGYVWVNIQSDIYHNRVACQKNNLRKLFNDPSIDIEHHSESEIMEEHGFVKVYNSGLIKWVWRK